MLFNVKVIEGQGHSTTFRYPDGPGAVSEVRVATRVVRAVKGAGGRGQFSSAFFMLQTEIVKL